MRVPLLDLTEQYRELAGPIRASLDSVLASHRFILGPCVERFEAAVSTFLRVGHAIGVSSGTDALLLALMALEIGPGDAVIVPGYSFFATAACVARLGATPVFVDCDPVTFNISTTALHELVEKECETVAGQLTISAKADAQTRLRVRAIVPVHLFGLCCEMDAIRQVSKKHGIEVIEDAAQAIGAEYCMSDGTKHKAGTMSTIGCFSCYPSKNLGAAGDAGFVATNDAALAGKLRTYRQHGMEPRYFHHVVGGNFRLDEIQAAILEVKLPHLDRWASARRAAADFYRHEFSRAGLTPSLTLPAEPFRKIGLTNHHVYHQFVVRTPRRDALRHFLGQRGIGTEIYYPLGLHEQKCFEYLGYKHGDLPETEKAAAETLALPLWPEIPRTSQSYVVETIAEFVNA
jgi:dTDP-4-amino-4,6-dideoxygalactose transaminase